MKKKLCMALAVLMLLCVLSACSGSAGKESSAPLNVTDYTMTLPEGFSVSADNDQLFLAPDYPLDGSNINVVPSEHDALFSTYSREILEAALEQQYADALGEQLDVVSESFERTAIDGVPAILYCCSSELYGVQLHQELVLVNADNQGYCFTFTQAGDADWTQAYQSCIASIKFTFES